MNKYYIYDEIYLTSLFELLLLMLLRNKWFMTSFFALFWHNISMYPCLWLNFRIPLASKQIPWFTSTSRLPAVNLQHQPRALKNCTNLSFISSISCWKVRSVIQCSALCRARRCHWFISSLYQYVQRISPDCVLGRWLLMWWLLYTRNQVHIY